MARRESRLGAAAWILWLRDEYGSFEKVSYGGRVLRNVSAMTAEREALRLGIEHLTCLFPTKVSSFDFQVECTGWTVQYKLNAQSLRLFGLHRDVHDAHRAGANRLQNKQTVSVCWPHLEPLFCLTLRFLGHSVDIPGNTGGRRDHLACTERRAQAPAGQAPHADLRRALLPVGQQLMAPLDQHPPQARLCTSVAGQ